jgi:hypothetical protein
MGRKPASRPLLRTGRTGISEGRLCLARSHDWAMKKKKRRREEEEIALGAIYGSPLPKLLTVTADKSVRSHHGDTVRFRVSAMDRSIEIHATDPCSLGCSPAAHAVPRSTTW